MNLLKFVWNVIYHTTGHYGKIKKQRVVRSHGGSKWSGGCSDSNDENLSWSASQLGPWVTNRQIQTEKRLTWPLEQTRSCNHGEFFFPDLAANVLNKEMWEKKINDLNKNNMKLVYNFKVFLEMSTNIIFLVTTVLEANASHFTSYSTWMLHSNPFNF